MRQSHLFRAALTVLVFPLLVACGGGKSRLPVYPVENLPDASTMQSYTAGSAKFSLPPGWIFQPQDGAREVAMGGKANKDVVGLLKKDSAFLVLSCWGTFMSKQAQPGTSRRVVTEMMPDAARIKSYQVITPGSQAPQLEIYSGTMVSDGQKAMMYGYASWKWNYGFGCKYGLSGFAPPKLAGEQFEREVAAILRSLN